MICLTGDLHHQSLQTGNQKACDISEIQVARRFVELLEQHEVKATFFVTGQAFDEEWSDLKPICEHPLIETGGHTYACFEPSLLHRAWKKLAGNYNGPHFYEKRDVQRCIDSIEQRTGQKIESWRNHMYMHGPNSAKILAEAGIKICSDELDPQAQGARRHPAGLWSLPINVMPDHEHLYHAERTPAWVKWWQQRYNWSDPWGPDSYFVEEWTDRVIAQVRANRERSAISTLIIHPITLYLCDGFRSLARLLEVLAEQPSVHVSEVPLHD